MSNLVALIRNENMKIYRRPRTWAMVLILVAVLGLLTFIIEYDQRNDHVPDDWRAWSQATIQNLERALQDIPAEDTRSRESLQEDIAIHEYGLAHDINPNARTLWDIAGQSASLIILITMLTVVVAADMIAAEFQWGAVKLLLIRPVSRTKILIAKYIATLQFAVLLAIVSLAVGMLLGIAMEGFGGFGHPNLVYADGAVHERSMLLSVLQDYGLNSVHLLMYVTFAFMISAAFRSSSMAIGFSLLCLLVGNTLVAILSKYEFVKYLLFANVDLSPYVNGGTPIRPDMTAAFSITVLAVYFVVFHLVSWLLFTRRDVAA